MNGVPGQSLQNVLSISTAANNRYLLHFNSLHSLTQWTAGIRLAMYEHATLQEAYTGSIIAGKGKHLNSIKQIMERTRYPTNDWVRVRFGAGTPWRRCWCVISPPTEKDVAAAKKQEKSLKKRSAYDRSPLDVKGDIKFYENRNIKKKTKPIATISDAFSAYAIYPQNKDLIEQSTLLKVEGLITIHSEPATTTEGFVFIMPESHAMVTGFEMLLKFLLPIYDVFNLYGRPDRLIADSNNTRSLMFGMPSNRRYGYLELIDVAGLIHTEGSTKWNEREWRAQMKGLTSKRMAMPLPSERTGSMSTHRRTASRSSLGNSPANRSTSTLPSHGRPGVKFGDENNAFRSTPSSRSGSPAPPPDPALMPGAVRRAESPNLRESPARHNRSASDALSYARTPVKASRLSNEINHYNEDNPAMPPQPPVHGGPSQPHRGMQEQDYDNGEYSDRETTPEYEGNSMPDLVSRPPVSAVTPSTQPVPLPVSAPPAFSHAHRAQPPVKPGTITGLQNVTNNLDPATMAQLYEATTPRTSEDRRPNGYFGASGPSTNGPSTNGPSTKYSHPIGPVAPTPPSHATNGNGYTVGQPMYTQPLHTSSSREEMSDLDQLANAPGMPAMLPERVRPSNSNPQLRSQTSHSSLLGPPPSHSSGASTPRRNMAAPTLATIPGTPAAMERNFDIPDMSSDPNVSRERSRESSRNRSSVERKPVGGGIRGYSPAGRF